MLLFAVFLISFSTLAFEVLLTRVFSIGQWNHLSFMVISIALFGFAAAGAYLSILDSRRKGWERLLSTTSSIATIVVLYTSSTYLSFIALNNIPLDYFRLPLEPIQLMYLLAAYILLTLPFFFSGLIISLSYAVVPEKAGLVYFASMAGSACGAVLPAPMLPYLGEEKLIVLSALLALMWIPFSVVMPDNANPSDGKNRRYMRLRVLPACLAILFMASFLMTPEGFSIIKIKPSPYKALSQILQFPDTRIVKTAAGIRGRIDRVKSPYIRFAPGLSLKYTAVLPHQSAIFKDGDNPFVLYHLDSARDAHFAKFTLSYSGYYLVSKPEKVLLIENDGGLAIPCALASGASQIRVAVQNPHLARIIRNHYKLPLIHQNPRAFLAQSASQFDIIQVENWGASIPGSDALTQDHLLTKNAFFEYLQHLAPDGLIIISRKLLLPPANTVRIWAEAYEGLKMFGRKSPESHLAMLRNWDRFTLIVSAKPLQNIAALIKFANDRNFDLVFLPPISREMVNKFNIFKEPYHFLEISRLAEAYRQGKEKDYFRSYIIDVVPQSDDRPFPDRFLKWSKLKALHKSMGSRLYALLMSGEIVVSAVFLEALVVTIILLFVPLFLILKYERKTPIYRIIYFFGVGAGFMFVELFFIKRFIIIFGDPVISFTVVLAGILVFSGLGALWAHQHKPTAIRLCVFILIATLIVTQVCIDRSVRHILQLSSAWHYICAILLLFPSGFLMGLPFPLGMRLLLQNSAQRSYAWSVNGCTSVLTSIGSAQIALSLGIPYIMGCAILAYILVLLSVPKR